MIDQLAPYSEPLQWFATLTAIGAALTVSLNLGARITGWAFVVFTASSLAWIAIGLIQGEPPLTLQNVVLTVINVIGIYRWLWIKAPEEDEMQVEEARLEEVETLAERAAHIELAVGSKRYVGVRVRDVTAHRAVQARVGDDAAHRTVATQAQRHAVLRVFEEHVRQEKCAC